MEQKINTETVLNSDWLKARKERAKKLKRRRELYRINRDKILAVFIQIVLVINKQYLVANLIKRFFYTKNRQLISIK